MGNSMIEQAIKLFREKRKYRYWLAAFLCLAVLVTLGTVTVLKMNGQAANHKQKLLDCQIELHEHTEGCYDSEGRVICGYADYAVHTHNDDCYDSEGTLVCQLPEVQAHTHSPECYQEKEELVCGLEESEGHVHTEECYTREQGALICGQEEFYIDETGAEQEAHVHTDDCYEWTETLSCGQKEGQGGHTHTESCYETKSELACGEQELHTHDETCYDQDGQLTCGLLELKEHVHGEECFETIELTKEEIETLNSAENPEKAEEAEKTVKTFEDETVKVTAEYGEFANISEEAELVVKQITEESDPEHFAERREEFQNQMGSEQASMDVLMDIGFYLDGEEIEPDDTVTVKIQFADGKEVSEAGPVNMVHFADDGTEVLEDSSVDDDGVITFEMDSFSEVALFAAGNLAIGKSRSADDTVRFHYLQTDVVTGEKKFITKGEAAKSQFNAETAVDGNKSFFAIKPYSLADDKLYELFGIEGYSTDSLATAVQSDPLGAWIGYSTDGGTTITVNTVTSLNGIPMWRLCDLANGVTSFTQSNITDIYYLPENTQTYTNEPLENIILGTEQPSQGFSVIFNPWNSTGDFSDDGKDGGGRWEYGIANPKSTEETGRTEVKFSGELVDENEAVIWLPGNDDLENHENQFDFDHCGKTDCISKAAIKGQAADRTYKYKLAGWYNIADEKYYKTGSNAVSAKIDTRKNNIFYADWIADESNFADNPEISLIQTENGMRDRAEYTEFITTKVFDYNELFNIYSTTYQHETSPITKKREIWSDSGLFSKINEVCSFIFFDGNRRTLGYPSNERTWNQSNQGGTTPKPSQGAWGPQLKTLLDDYLFNENDERLGVHYLGEGEFLYKLGTETNNEGYYLYDSDENGASYNPSENRFYIQEKTDCIKKENGETKAGFFPLNKPFGDTAYSMTDGSVNYHFGMNSEINFYLPGDVPKNENDPNYKKVNQYKGRDMVFEFSGDDDVWVFIDDKLVLDMGGVHGKVDGSINFSTGKCEVFSKDPQNNKVSYNADISSIVSTLEKGKHTLKVYYLERGGFESNCKIKFNIIPRYKIETPEASTVTIKKEWRDNETSHTPVTAVLSRYYMENGSRKKDETFSEEVELNEGKKWQHLFEGLEVYKDPATKLIEYIYEVDEKNPPIGYEKKVQSKIAPQGGQSWLKVDASNESEIAEKEVIFLNVTGNKALGVSDGEKIEGFNVKTVKEGVLSSDSVTDNIKWKVTAADGSLLLESKQYPDRFLNIEGDIGGSLLLVNNKEGASKFEPDNVDGGGFSAASHRIIFDDLTEEFKIGSNNLTNEGIESGADKSKRVISYMEKVTKLTECTITNTQLADVTIAKVDSSTDQLLSGAEFSLNRQILNGETATTQYYDGQQWISIQNDANEPKFEISNGELRLSDLSPGTYTLTEEKAPASYKLNSAAIQFQVENGKINRIISGSAEITGNVLKVKNEKEEPEKATIKFVKVGSTSGHLLSGAEFSLYSNDDSKNSINGVAVSDENGVFFEGELAYGTYRLSETKAPDGYNKLSQDVIITISKGKVTVNNPNLSSDDREKEYSINEEGYYEIKIPNSTGYKLPHTGGSGTYPFAIGSAVLFSTAAFLLYGYSIRQKRRQKRLHR
ncbi:MAG: fibro-slime domain-containing protein [Lachnospiraceae bacterium]|nr:fibro-slime domain-containing protein [Lachnospiraceae bacterium]